MDLAEDFFRTVLEECGDGIAVFDNDFRYLYLNVTLERWTERSRGELLGRSFWECWPGVERSSLAPILRKTMEERTPLRHYHPFPERPGTWYELRADPLLFPPGHPAQGAILVRWRDATREKEAEIARGHLAMSLEIGEVGTWEMDIPQRVLYISPRIAQRFEPTVRESGRVTYDEWRTRVHPEDRKRVADRLERLFEGADYDAEFRVIARNGETRWIAARGAVIEFDAETNQPLRAVGVSRDITAAKKAEADHLAALDSLRASEAEKAQLLAQLRLAMRVAQMGTWEFDAATLETRVSEGTDLLYGIPAKGPGEKRTLEEYLARVHPEDAPRIRKETMTAIGQGVDIGVEYRILRPDGTMRWVASRGNVLLNADGNVDGMVGAIFDITDHKAAEERLQESESQLRALADAMPGIVWTTPADSGVDYVNQRWYEYTGLERDASLPETLAEVIHPDELPATLVRFEHSQETGVPFLFEQRLRGRDGIYRWFQARAVAYRNSEGQIVKWFGISTDIDELKRAERALNERNTQWRALFENAREAIGIAARGAILYVNPAYAFLLGYAAPEEMIGMGFQETVAPSDRVRLSELAVRRAAGEDVPSLYPYRGRKKDGTEVDLENYVSSYELDGVLYTVVTTRDITDRRRAMEEIRGLNTRLQQAMTETHHRVKNNLQVISSLLELAAMNGGGSVSKDEITRLTQHLRSLASIHDLMTVETKQGGDMDRLSAQAILERLIPGLRTVMGLESRLVFRTEDATFTSRQATTIALITNELVTNAVKHGASEMEVEFTVDGQRGHLAVRDNGPGFPPRFDPERGSHTGLELVRNLAAWDLRGEIIFENRPEGGGCVLLHMPLDA